MASSGCISAHVIMKNQWRSGRSTLVLLLVSLFDLLQRQTVLLLLTQNLRPLDFNPVEVLQVRQLLYDEVHG